VARAPASSGAAVSGTDAPAAPPLAGSGPAAGHPTATAGGFAGHLDAINAGALAGWAFDPTDPLARLKVRVFHGRRVVGRGVARNPRLDIKAGLGHPDGRVGFRVEVSEADWDAILRHPEGLSVVLLHPAAAAAGAGAAIAGAERPLPVGPALAELRARQALWQDFLGEAWTPRPVEVAIACILRDEAAHLPEWLVWHVALGVQLIRLYDNGSTDGLAEAVAPYVAAGLVEVVPWPALRLEPEARAQHWPEQNLAYMHALATLRDRADWLALIDVDEFVMLGPGEAGSLPAFLRTLPPEADLVTLYWRRFGSGGHQRRPPGLAVEAFQLRAEDRPGPEALHKPLLRPSRAGFVVNAHAPVMRDGASGVPEGTGPRLRSPAALGPAAQFGRIWLNHYHTRSREEFEAKVARGWPAVDAARKAGRPEAWFAENDHAAVADAGALRFAPATRAMLARAGRFGAAPPGVGAPPPPPPTLRARIAVVARPEEGRLLVTGAAVDLARPDRRLEIAVHDAFGAQIGRIAAGAADRGLLGAGLGDGRHGFRVTLRVGRPTLALSRLHFRIGGAFGLWREAWPVAACADLADPA
jgi:glycosyl transferase family 92